MATTLYVERPAETLPVLHAAQELGDESPLHLDDDGHATVDDDEAAALLVRRRSNVHFADPQPTEDTDDADGFDVATFVDRVPMATVIEDLESGDYDEHLNDIADAATRKGVLAAIDARREVGDG